MEKTSDVFIQVFMSSEEDVKQFTKMLVANYADNNSKNVCATCWCFCNRYQTQKHKSEMGHTVLTPRFVRDWQSFKQLAEQCQRFRVSILEGDDEDKISSHHQKMTKQYERITGHNDINHSA
jgi:uncharacterized lipoprotein